MSRRSRPGFDRISDDGSEPTTSTAAGVGGVGAARPGFGESDEDREFVGTDRVKDVQQLPSRSQAIRRSRRAQPTGIGGLTQDQIRRGVLGGGVGAVAGIGVGLAVGGTAEMVAAPLAGGVVGLVVTQLLANR